MEITRRVGDSPAMRGIPSVAQEGTVGSGYSLAVGISVKFIVGLLLLIIGLGIALQITVGPALKRREMKLIKRQLEDMSVIEGSIDNHKARQRDREGGSSS